MPRPFTHLALALLLLCFAPLGCASRPHIAPPPASLAAVGASHRGDPLLAETFGAGPRRIYVIAGIHGDEREGAAGLDALRRALIEKETFGASVRLLHDMNPDGSRLARRTNSRGVDLNRNWPAANFKPASSRGSAPLCEPESAAVHADILAFDPHVVVVVHSARNGPFVNFDGPPAAAVLARAFADAARLHDPRWKVLADMGYPTPGSMGSYFGLDRGVPILTIEFKRGDPSPLADKILRDGVRRVAAGVPTSAPSLSRAKPVSTPSHPAPPQARAEAAAE